MISKLTKLACITAAVAGLASSALAITFTATSGSPTFLSGNATATGTLDITSGNTPNYNPATMVLTSATVKFAFADTNEPGGASWWDENDVGSSNREYVTVKLDGSTFMSGVEVDGTHAAYDWTSVSGSITGTIFTSLQTDGKLNYVVSVTSGDTWFKGAQLSATGDYRNTNTPGVPDAGSTVALLGGAMIALAMFRRRV